MGSIQSSPNPAPKAAQSTRHGHAAGGRGSGALLPCMQLRWSSNSCRRPHPSNATSPTPPSCSPRTPRWSAPSGATGTRSPRWRGTPPCGSWSRARWTTVSWCGTSSPSCARSASPATRCGTHAGRRGRGWGGWAGGRTSRLTGLRFHLWPPTSAGPIQAAVYSVAFSPTTPLIASGSKDRTVRLWPPTVCVPPAGAGNASQRGGTVCGGVHLRGAPLWAPPRARARAEQEKRGGAAAGESSAAARAPL